MLPVEKIATDILVVGGGAAGLTAALEARSLGRDVTILSKSKVGRSGNTIVSGTGMAMLTRDPESEDSPEIYGRDTLKSGKDVNDRPMMKIFLKGSTDIVETLTRYGVMFRKLDGRFMKKRVPGHSMPRSLTTDFGRYPYLSRGLSLSEPLLRSAEKSGIRIIDFAPVIRLLTADGAICGAVAIGKKEEKTLVFSAPTIILAAGGGGRIYSRSNNTFDMTGDAYALACEAGATLRDMEFVQFYPTMMFSPIKVTVSSPLLGEGAFLRNSLGERFMERYDPAGDMATRDIMTRAMFNEVIEGRGRNGDIFMDCRHLSRDVLTRKYPELLRLLSKVNLDPSRDLLPISPATHFFMGGVAIDPACQTSVPGLLACGEAAGGLHGANRLGGNALSEAFVFGTIAGRRAAAIGGGRRKAPQVDIGEIEPYRDGDVSLPEMKGKLRETTWKYLSIIRDQRSGEKAIEEISAIERSSAHAGIASVHELVSFYELKNMALTARLIALGSIARRESRGAHFRSDHPVSKDSYRGNFFLRQVDGKLRSDFVPIL
ncbi:MAG: FAD-dependent oxidoreductase [Desulfobacteraceae bacterium]|nr:MAG: FAD-dependent oxidoreductase [Desulfobacteraceae bacterium]